MTVILKVVYDAQSTQYLTASPSLGRNAQMNASSLSEATVTPTRVTVLPST